MALTIDTNGEIIPRGRHLNRSEAARIGWGRECGESWTKYIPMPGLSNGLHSSTPQVANPHLGSLSPH